MGYSTDFTGEFNLDKPLTEAHAAYLRKFSETRRMARHADATMVRADPLRKAVGLPVGDEGGYFVGENGFAGQDDGPDVVKHNDPPVGQPDLWCKWEPNEDGTAIIWSEAEKFYRYIEWIEYLIAHFLKPWGYTLNGNVEWQGEEMTDRGVIFVRNNIVKTGTFEIKEPTDPFE